MWTFRWDHVMCFRGMRDPAHVLHVSHHLSLSPPLPQIRDASALHLLRTGETDRVQRISDGLDRQTYFQQQLQMLRNM